MRGILITGTDTGVGKTLVSAVILARYEDMSYDEIAETMGMSLEAVKSVLFRAKENLKQALSKYARGSS